MVARSWPRCAFWLVASVFPLFAAQTTMASDAAGELPMALVIVSLFGLQGFVAEFIGVRADADGASFPRRMQPLGFPVFWRMRLPAASISRVDPAGRCAVRFFLTSGDFVDLLVADRRQKQKLLRDVGVRGGRRACGKGAGDTALL